MTDDTNQETTDDASVDDDFAEVATAEAPDSGDDAGDIESLPEAPVVQVLIEGPEPDPLISGKVDRQGVALGTGRRKTAVARIRITSGTGELTINGRALEEYFPLLRDREMILAPLRATKTEGQINIWVRVKGGGATGQTGAIVLGIARALEARNHDLHATLSEGGFLTRDGRMVERKKYGLRKARRSFQFSKR